MLWASCSQLLPPPALRKHTARANRGCQERIAAARLSCPPAPAKKGARSGHRLLPAAPAAHFGDQALAVAVPDLALRRSDLRAREQAPATPILPCEPTAAKCVLVLLM